MYCAVYNLQAVWEKAPSLPTNAANIAIATAGWLLISATYSPIIIIALRTQTALGLSLDELNLLVHIHALHHHANFFI